MTALDHHLLSPYPTPVNTTATLPVSWGEEWVPPEDPFPSPPRGRRKRGGSLPWGRGARRRNDNADGEWDGKEYPTAHLNASSALAEILGFNVTAEDVDYYMFNISKGGGVPWRNRNEGYSLNSGNHGHNSSIAHRKRKQSSSKGNESCYCGDTNSILRRMAVAYRPVHPVAALTVCALGTLANALNVAVLTRPQLASAPVNRLLTAIAAADAALMVEYAVFAIIVWIPHSKVRADTSPETPTMTPAEEAARAERDFPFAAAAFVLFHMHFSQVLHTISICLTLTLAVWRLLALRLPPERARILCSRRRCSVALAISVLLPPLLCSPSYLVFGITTTHVTMGAQHAVVSPQEDLSVSSIDYIQDPGLLPTVAMVLDEREGFSTKIPSSVPTELSQMDWSSNPRGDEGRDWESSQPPTPMPWVPSVPTFSYLDRPTVTPHPAPAVAVVYHLDLSEVAKGQDEMLYIVNFWVYAVILKLIPCLVLTVISFCLVRTLCRAKSRRRALQSQGDVKKASQNKTVPSYRWKKTEENVTVSTPKPPPIPPSEVRNDKPLDDGGIWMGREEVKNDDVEKSEEVPEQRTTETSAPEEEEDAIRLVPVEQPSAAANDGEASQGESRRNECWLSRMMSKRRERLASERGEGGCRQSNAVAVVGAAVRRRRRRTERTTRMLVAVLVLFLVTEFPQGVLGLMSGLIGRCFFRTCYHLFGDLMDLLALLNGSINFILYCAMSRQFRQTFAQLFCKHPRVLWTYFYKKNPTRQNREFENMKNGNMGREGLRKLGTMTVGGQTSQSMGEVQSTYV